MPGTFLCGFLILTYKCNNRCSFCYASPSRFGSDMMPAEKAIEFLDLMHSLGIKTVGLCGGEPVMHPYVLKIIRHADKLGIGVTIYTNGRRLKEEKFARKLKAAGTAFVNFSVQGGPKGKDLHDRAVGVKGAWEETREGIENCHKLGMSINIQTVLAHDNFDVYRDILDEFAYTKALFIFYREVPPVSDDIFSVKVLSNEKTKNIYKRIFMYAQERKIRTYFFSRMPLCWWNPDDKIERKISENAVSYCHAISGRNLIIDLNGKVLPCAQWINLGTMDMLKDGKVISKEKFISEYNHGNPQKVRDSLVYFPDKVCKSCKYFGKRCTGGCPLVKFELGPHYREYRKSPGR